MRKSAPAAISQRPASRPTDAIVRRWIVSIAELCGKDLTEPLVELWCRLLCDIQPELLDRALEETARTCTRFFPTPGEIRARIKQAEAGGLQLRAEDAWQRVLKFVERGPWSGSKELDAQMQHAARAAGGLGFIESCSTDELPWAKKRFIDDYKLIHETGQVQHLLSEGEAKELIQQLATDPKLLLPTKSATVPASPEAPPDDSMTRALAQTGVRRAEAKA